VEGAIEARQLHRQQVHETWAGAQVGADDVIVHLQHVEAVILAVLQQARNCEKISGSKKQGKQRTGIHEDKQQEQVRTLQTHRQRPSNRLRDRRTERRILTRDEIRR
jgi:hypothetical protein